MGAYWINLEQVGAADTADAFPLDERTLLNANYAVAVDWGFDDPVLMHVREPLAGRTDAPLVTTVGAPILSRRVADALLELGGFDVVEYPIQLLGLSDNQPVGAPGDFVIFHVHTILDVLDVESPGVRVRRQPGSIFDGMIRVDEPALLVPEGGLPTCFQVKHAGSFGVFLNEAGRRAVNALEPAGFVLMDVPTRRADDA